MRALVAGVVLITACESATSNTPAPVPIALPPAAVAPPPPAPPPPPVAVAPPPVDPDVAAAPVWRGRAMYTGQIRATSEHDTFELQLASGKASLVVHQRIADTTLKGAIGAWSAPETRTFRGTYDGKTLRLTDDQPSTAKEDRKSVELTCATRKVAVAAATAGRVREGKDSCSGDVGKWTPATTKKVTALVCGDPMQELDLGFAVVDPKTPMIEMVYVNDDCVQQGGGYRAVPTDGSIASPRP